MALALPEWQVHLRYPGLPAPSWHPGVGPALTAQGMASWEMGLQGHVFPFRSTELFIRQKASAVRQACPLLTGCTHHTPSHLPLNIAAVNTVVMRVSCWDANRSPGVRGQGSQHRHLDPWHHRPRRYVVIRAKVCRAVIMASPVCLPYLKCWRKRLVCRYHEPTDQLIGRLSSALGVPNGTHSRGHSASAQAPARHQSHPEADLIQTLWAQKNECHSVQRRGKLPKEKMLFFSTYFQIKSLSWHYEK